MHEHSAVWLAMHNSLGVKRIIKGIRKDSPFYDRLIAEARLMINLNHPGIPSIYDVEEDYNYTCIIEEYIEGESLGALCSHRLLSEKEIYSFIFRIGSVIEYLHSRPECIVYLDLKPENVIISGGEAWLVDFASAMSKSSQEHTVTADSASPGYTAPEQKAHLPVDRNADVYALGKLLDYMTDHSSLDADRRKKLKSIAKRCAQETPWKRISSADILMKMLNRQRKAETTSDPEISDLAQGRKYKRIGVLGLKPGEGATTVAVALAHSLAKKRKNRVVLVEKSDHSDLCCLQNEPAAEPVDDTGCFELRGVTYVISQTAVLEHEFTGDADYVIYDLGSNVNKAAATLAKCELCIAVATAAPWRRQNTGFLGRPEFEAVAGSDWRLIINHTQGNIPKDMKTCGVVMEAFTYVEDPTRPDMDTVGLFERTMR